MRGVNVGCGGRGSGRWGVIGGSNGGGWVDSRSMWDGVFFFFSSRRRHTRLQGDWSSDVCSSDLNHPFLNREPLEPSVPKQKTIGTTHF